MSTNKTRYLTRKSPGVVVEFSEPDHDEMYHQRGTSNCGEAWKLDVGAECNRLMDIAEGFEQGKFAIMGPGATHNEHATIVRSIVQRVATFEELEVES